MNINKLAAEIYENNKAVGWWDNPNRCIYECLQLVSTEIAEATEGERKNLMDDHLPNRKMGEVELADAIIRLLDLGGKMEWEYVGGLGFHEFIHGEPSIGKQHLACNMAICMLANTISARRAVSNSKARYSVAINTIFEVGRINNYDIWSAVSDKIVYNKTRADHKRENRELANGKKF